MGENPIHLNFNDTSIRRDIGSLWENFCIAERVKFLKINHEYRNLYYWRTYTQRELDYVEEYNGEMHGYEMKWGKGKLKAYKDFLEAYGQSSIRLINRETFWDFAQGK